MHGLLPAVWSHSVEQHAKSYLHPPKGDSARYREEPTP